MDHEIGMMYIIFISDIQHGSPARNGLSLVLKEYDKSHAYIDISINLPLLERMFLQKRYILSSPNNRDCRQHPQSLHHILPIILYTATVQLCMDDSSLEWPTDAEIN
eukprot:scaffold6012_cov127-Cylindrotheca_fusiformis.AAC.2